MTLLRTFTLFILLGLLSQTISKRCLTPPSGVKNWIPTTRICSRQFHITVDDLPEPYASGSVNKTSVVKPIPSDASLRVPNGFTVNVYADKLNGPRWLQLTPNGEVLVTITYEENKIFIMDDADDDGVADSTTEQFAGPENGLNKPFGMAFVEGYFYLGNTNEVRRYPYTRGQRRLEGTGEKIADLPGEGNHWTRNVKVSPDGTKLYVAIGSKGNAEIEPPLHATVQVMNLDGSNQETFVSGARNPNGLDFHPITGELYATINERDELGDGLVPDYFTRLQQGEFYGYPYSYLSPDNIDPRLTDENGNSLEPGLVAQTKTPDVLFESHSAALGMQFYNGSTFPKKYQNGAFVAFRGSWNRNKGTGYKVVFVPFGTDNRPKGNYENFVTGFVIDPYVPSVWGRPVGILVNNDGSLLFTEEENGRIYRVQYRG